MLNFNPENWDQILDRTAFPEVLAINDHLGGFDVNCRNLLLDHISNNVDRNTTILNYYVFDEQLKQQYPNLTFKLDKKEFKVFQSLQDYNMHPPLNYKNFICSFNGMPHVGRKLLVSALQKFNFFNENYCTKNFSIDSDMLDGHVQESVTNSNFYMKFFSFDSTFLNNIYSDNYQPYNHMNNIQILETRLTESFLHIVSETMATSYVPFMSEKSFYSIATRGLFLTHAQPGWHDHFEKYFGFKKYNKLFDYRFDTIQNPVERLIELVTMVSKFSCLSPAEWHDLYLIEQDTIEYNYDHYFSGNYLTQLKQYED
jgi:hypothetical protein